MKRLISFISICVLLFNAAAAPIRVFAAPGDDVSVSDNAASDNNASENEAANGFKRIELRSAADLEDLAKNCHDDAWSVDKEVVLMSDIFLNSSDFPLPYSRTGRSG